MDVRHTTHSAWFSAGLQSLSLGALALAISLGELPRVAAEDSVATDAQQTSTTLFITDEATSEPVSQPSQSAAGSLVVVEDVSPSLPIAQAKFVEPKQNPRGQVVIASSSSLPEQAQVVPAPAHGDLKVVSNGQKPIVLEPVVISEPLITDQPLPRELTPKVLHVATPLLLLNQPVQEQSEEIQVAAYSEVAVTDEETAIAPQANNTATVARLLVTAHQLSAQAASEEDYGLIVEACSEAIQMGAQDDQLIFAKQLSSWALNRRGQMRADASQRELADADFQKAIDLSSNNWRALHNRGVSYAQANKLAEAFDDFNAVINLNPTYAKAYANRATLYVQANDLQLAIKDYNLALKQNGQFATAHVGLGRVHHMLNEWDEAIDHFTMAVQLKPESATIVCSRGDLHADMGHYPEALADYARTIELDPEFAHAYRNGAWLLATCPDERYRDPQNAILGAQQALEYSYGEKHVAFDTLAAAYASNGQFDEAIATVNKALELAPEDTKHVYLSRMKLYEINEPFRTEPVGDVSQVVYEVTDQDEVSGK